MSQPQAAVATPSPRRLNVPFLAAFAIVVGVYAVSFLLLRALMPREFEQMAGTLAALALGGGAYVQRQLERSLRMQPGPVLTRAGYQKPWALLLLAAVGLVWVAESANPFLSLRGGPMTAVLASVGSLLTLIAPATALLVGVVVAQRSNRWPLPVTLTAVAAGWLLAGLTYALVIGFATGTDPGVVPPGAGPPPGPGMPPNPVEFYYGPGLIGYLLASDLPLLVGAAMLGHWYGTRTRLQAYLGGLLRELRPEDRETIVDMTYDAARARNVAASDQRSSGS